MVAHFYIYSFLISLLVGEAGAVTIASGSGRVEEEFDVRTLQFVVSMLTSVLFYLCWTYYKEE